MRPRVWFGERWITSVFDLFEENVRYFPAVLRLCDEEDPRRVLDDGGVPELHELRLHNGTVYRWNRPVYDISDGVPHLRVENRVLPAGPTVADIAANAAFYYGLMRVLPAAGRSSHRAEASATTGSTDRRTMPAGETSARAAIRGEPAVRATAAPSELPTSTTSSRPAAARTSSSTRPYQASLPRHGRRGSLSPGWPGKSTTVTVHCTDSASSHGSTAAAQ